MKLLLSFGAGLAGAVVLTGAHQILKHTVKDAPRMDKLGRESLTRLMSKLGLESPDGRRLQAITLAADIVSNAAFYALAGASRRRKLLTGGLLGAGAGIGAVLLPKPLGLDERASNRTTKTKLLTTALYLTGGLVAGAVARAMRKK